MIERTIEEKVRQRRAQMLVHSYLYYWKDEPIVSDDDWQRWANELTELQKTCPKIGWYDKEFADWDGSTGMHLPRDSFSRSAAQVLLDWNWLYS